MIVNVQTSRSFLDIRIVMFSLDCRNSSFSTHTPTHTLKLPGRKQISRTRSRRNKKKKKEQTKAKNKNRADHTIRLSANVKEKISYVVG